MIQLTNNPTTPTLNDQASATRPVSAVFRLTPLDFRTFCRTKRMLAAASRTFSRSQRVWSIWTGDTAGGPGDYRAARRAAKGHIDPFGIKLGRQLRLSTWTARHQLTADAPTGGETAATRNRWC